MLRKHFIVVEQSALAVGGHYSQYTTAIARAARTAAYVPIVLRNRRAAPETFPNDIETRPTFALTWGEAEYGTDDDAPMRFGAELHAALSDLRAGPDDVVLVHTLGYRELLDLLDLLCRRPPDAANPTLHVLLRYDPEPLAHMIGTYRPYFERIRRSPTLSRAVVFHADTERLARVLSRLTGTTILHAPIPFDQTYLRAALAGTAARTDERLTVLYLGDARSEKGYARLPAAIASLWTDLVEPGRVRFVIQSNFNTPGGEAGVLTAQQQLAAYADQRVRLLPEALDPSDYYRHLAEADIALIPYDAARYRERSSGVLVEAMAAGLPVVTSAGSWMETQVSTDNAVLFDGFEELAGALRQAVANYPTLKAGALARQEAALEQASPDAFIRHVAAATARRSDAERPRVLYVMNGDAMVLRNGSSQVARSQLQYLAEADYAVVGLFLSHQRLEGAELTARRTALTAILHDFAFERVFVATPGHPWPDTASSGSGTLAEDFANAATYEIGAAVAGFLRANPVDLVLLNYVTALPLVEALGVDAPVVCEMHDLQAVQRAIYAGRQVRADELALEMAHLSRCRHVISLSPRETTFVRDALPGMAVTTIGVQITPAPVRLADLAGLRNLADVVAACGPQLPVRRPMLPHDPLLDATAIDVLFISSAHVSNVSGLRWFLETVRAPFLPNIRVVVAGSICDLGPWPEGPGLHFVGQLDDLAPLYAAARIVVLPIREGAGSAVKTYEALAYGKPIVATSLALRGLTEMQGLIAQDDPEAFAAAVGALLSARDLRASAAAAARVLAARLGDPAPYRAALHNVIRGVLEDRTPRLPESPATETGARGEHVEWSPLLGAVNRLCRRIIAGEVPDLLLGRELAASGADETLALVEQVARTILETQPTFLLRTSADVAAGILRFGAGGSVETIVEAARIMMGIERDGTGHHVLLGGRDAFSVVTSGGAGTENRVRVGMTALRYRTRDGATCDYRPSMDAHPYLGVALEGTATTTWSVVRPLGLDERRAAPRPVTSGDGGAIRLTLPVASTGTSWIEFDRTEDPSDLEIRIAGVVLPTIRCAGPSAGRIRAMVPRELPRTPFVPVILEFRGGADPAAIRALNVGWSSQPIDALLAADARTGGESSAEGVPGESPSALSQLFSGMLRRSSHIRTTRPLCVSPALSLIIVLDRPSGPAESLRCFADDQELPRTESADGRLSFVRAGATSDSWCPRIQVLHPRRNPLSGTVTISLDGLTDAATGDGGFTATNLHGPEYEDGRISHRWSGADAVTILDLPAWSTGPARLEIFLAALGLNEAAGDVAVAVDGEPAATERSERDGTVVLTAPIAPRKNAGSTRVEVAVRRTFQPEGDPRKLGVAFRTMRLVYPFTADADA